MGSNIIELSKLGHERAAELKASCGAVDVRSLAQLISDLASQLEVQYVRAEESQHEFRSADITMQNLEAKCEKLAAENAGLKGVVSEINNELYGQGFQVSGWHLNGALEPLDNWFTDNGWGEQETPATCAFLAEGLAHESAPLVRALTVIANSEQHDGETVVCDFDTLISVAAGALRDHYAAQLRKGAAL